MGWEDPLEKVKATLCSTLAWKIPWMEDPGRLQSVGSQSWTRLRDFTHFSNTFNKKLSSLERERLRENLCSIWNTGLTALLYADQSLLGRQLLSINEHGKCP